MKRLMLIALSMVMVACDNTGPLDAKDPKALYLESNLPHLKSIREELAFEYIACKHNIEKLQAIAASFEHEVSKNRICIKVESMKVLRDQLKAQLNKIDAEAEQGIALREINKIDGGGLRLTDTHKLLAQSANCLKNAKAANSSVGRIYQTSDDELHPPKVIPVRKH